MSLIGAKLICLDEKEEHYQVIEAKGRKFTIGYYMSCDHILDDKSSKGYHCEINCDAYGRVTIHNKSEEHPVSVNDNPITIKRPLLSGSKITILGKNFIWDFPRVTSSEYEDLNAATMSTPEKQVGIPEQPPNSCPDLKLHRDIQRRFTVHNFAYSIQFNDEGNTSNDFGQAEESTVEPENKDIKLVPVMEETATEERCVTPEAHNNDSLIVGNVETPKMNLINCTQNKENASTEKKMKLLSLCHQSDIVITSFSPRETGVRIEKSFATILRPTTPKSVYSTPKSVLSELNDDGSKDCMEFSTPATSQKTLTRSVNNSSMHLIDLTTPSKMRPESPNPKYMVKSTTSRNAMVTKSDKKKQFDSVLKECGVSPLGTPVAGYDTKPFETPDSVISVDSTDSSESVLGISVKESPANFSATAIKTPTKSAGTSKISTPKRTPQSLMKRALLTSAKKQLKTLGNTTATTPFRSLAQTTPSVSRKISSNLSPLTPKSTLTKSKITPKSTLTKSEIKQRPNIASSINRSILVKGSPDVSAGTSSSITDSFAARRSSLFSGESSRLPTSTPLQRSRAELRTSAKTSPLRKVRRSVGGCTLSSRISKHGTSLAVPTRVSPTGSSSSAIASAKLKRKSLHYLSPSSTRARAIAAAATPSSILKDLQSSRKANDRKSVVFSERTNSSLESENLNSTFTLEADDKSELEVIDMTAKDATFSPVKDKNDDIPVKLQIHKNEMINKEKEIVNVEDETEADNKSQYEENNEEMEKDKIVGTRAKDATFSPVKVKELDKGETSIEIIELLDEGKSIENESEIGNSINDKGIEMDVISLPVKSTEKLVNSSGISSLEKDDNENNDIENIKDENDLSKTDDIKEKAEFESSHLLLATIIEKDITSDENIIEATEVVVNENEVIDCFIEEEQKEIDVDCSNIKKKEDDAIDNMPIENISFSLVKSTEEVSGIVGINENVETENEMKTLCNQNQYDNAVLDYKNSSTTETLRTEMNDIYEKDIQNIDKLDPAKDDENNDDLLDQIEEVLNKSDELQKNLELSVGNNISSTDMDEINVIKDDKKTTVSPTLEHKEVEETMQIVEGEIDIQIKSALDLQIKDIKQNVSSISQCDEPVVSTSIVTVELIDDKNSTDNGKLQEFDLLSSKLASLDDNNEPITPNLKGIRELLKTPKHQKILKTPNFIGVRNLMRTPKTIKSDESDELFGVEALLKTPAVDIVEENKEISKIFTPRRSVRRVSMSAETCRACITPLTPKRITKRRSSISIDTEIAVLTPKQRTTTPHRKPIFEDSTVEDMGIIVEEISSTVTFEKNTTQNSQKEVLGKSECNISTLESNPCVVNESDVVVDHGVLQAAVLIEEDTCEILEISECQETPFIKEVICENTFENAENSLTSEVLEIENSCGLSEHVKKSISTKADLKEPLGEILDQSEYDYGKEVKDINDDCTINETLEATTPKTSKKEKSAYKMAKTSERSKIDVKEEDLHKTPRSIKFRDVLEDDKPSTSGDSKCNLIGLQLKTPKGCSTPHTKTSATAYSDGIKKVMDTTDIIVQKLSTTACENVNITLDNEDFNQTEDEGLDKFFRTPRAKNIMVLTSPTSVNVKKSIDSVELIHSTEYDLNTTNVENLEDIFKTPVAGTRFVDDDDEIVNLAEVSNVDDSDKKIDAEINEMELSAEEAFDNLVGLPSSNQTPARKSYTRKSFVKSLHNSPFTASDIISDLPKTDIQDWVDSLESPSDSELEISDIQEQAQEEGGDQEITMVENDTNISRDPLTASIIKSSESSLTRIVYDSLKCNTETSESMLNISTSSSMIDPLSCSAIVAEDKNLSSLRRLSPVDESLNEKMTSPEETEISGINMLDQTDECDSVLSEPLLVLDNTNSTVGNRSEVENTIKPLVIENNGNEFEAFIEKPQLGLGQRSATPNNIKLQSNPLRRSLDIKGDITVSINFESEKLKTIAERSDQNVQETICVEEQITEEKNIQQKGEIILTDKQEVGKGEQVNYAQEVNIDSEAGEDETILSSLESQNVPTQTSSVETLYKEESSTTFKLQNVTSESECTELYKIANEEELGTCHIDPGKINLKNKKVESEFTESSTDVSECTHLPNETITVHGQGHGDASNENVGEDNQESKTENVTLNNTSDDKNSDLDEKSSQSLVLSEKESSNIAATTSIGMEDIFGERESTSIGKDNMEANDETINTDKKEIPVELIGNQEISNLMVDDIEKSSKESFNQKENTVDITLASNAENSFANIEATVSTQCSMGEEEKSKEIKPIDQQIILSSGDIINTDKIEKSMCADNKLVSLRENSPENIEVQSCDPGHMVDDTLEIGEVKNNSNIEEGKNKDTQNSKAPDSETPPEIEEQNYKNDFICDERNETTSDISETKNHQLEHYNEEETEQSNMLEETKDPIPCISSEKFVKTEESNSADDLHVAEENFSTDNMILKTTETSKNTESESKNTENSLGIKTEKEKEVLQSQKNDEEKVLSKRTLRKGSKDAELPKLRGRKVSKDSQYSVEDDDEPPKRRGRKGSSDSQHSLKDEEISKERSTLKKVQFTIAKIDEESTHILENQSSESCTLLPTVENASSAPLSKQRNQVPQASTTQSESLTQDEILIHSEVCKSNDPDKQSVVEPLIETEIVHKEQENNDACDSVQLIEPKLLDNKEKTSQEPIQSTEIHETEMKTRRGGRKKIVEEKLKVKEPVGRPKRRNQKTKVVYTENPDSSEAVDSTNRHYEEENAIASEEISQKANETDKEATEGKDDSNITMKQTLLPEENVCEDENTGNDKKHESPENLKIAAPRRGGRQRKQEIGKYLSTVKEINVAIKLKTDENIEKTVAMIADQETESDLIKTTNLTTEVTTESINEAESTKAEQITNTKTRQRGRKRKESFSQEEKESKTENHEVEVKNDNETVPTISSRGRRRKLSETDNKAVSKTEDHDTEVHPDEEPLVEKSKPRGRRPKVLRTDHKTETDHKSVTKTEDHDTEAHTDEEPLVAKAKPRGRRPKVLRTDHKTETQTKDHEIMRSKEIELVNATKSIDTKQMISNDDDNALAEEHVLKTETKNQQVKLNKPRGRNRKASLTEDETFPNTEHETEIPKSLKSKDKNQTSELESARIDEHEMEKKTSKLRTKKRNNLQTDYEVTVEKDVEPATKRAGRKNTTAEQKSESPKQNVSSRRTRKTSTVDHIVDESTPIPQIRGRGGRRAAAVTSEKMIAPQEDIPEQAVAALRHTRKASTFDEHEKETTSTPKLTRGRGTRKEVPMTLVLNEDDNQMAESQDNSPLPENINDAKKSTSDDGETLTTSRGRMRKPTARAQQFLEEERAKASTPKKRLLLQSAGADSPTPQKLPARRGRKPSTIESETPQQAKKNEIAITESTSEQSQSEFDHSSEPADILKEKESTSNTRKRNRKPDAKSQHIDKDEDEPVEKVVAKRTEGRRGRIVETKKIDGNDDDSTEAKEDVKSTKNRGSDKSQKVGNISKRDRLESATTVDDESDVDENVLAVQIDEETPSTSAAALAKKRNATSRKEDAPIVKRGRRKALIEEDDLEVPSTPKARHVGRPRKVVAQITPVTLVEVKEQEENTPKRTTRATRKK